MLRVVKAALQLSHCIAWRDVDALWPQPAADADLWVVTWCGFLPAASSRFLWRWLGGKNWEETCLMSREHFSAPCIAVINRLMSMLMIPCLVVINCEQHHKYQLAWLIGLAERRPQTSESFCMIDWIVKHWDPLGQGPRFKMNNCLTLCPWFIIVSLWP